MARGGVWGINFYSPIVPDRRRNEINAKPEKFNSPFRRQ
jgi:hypothetical protein